MKKQFLILILLIFSCSVVLSTEQFPDILIVENDTVFLKSFPLEDLISKKKFQKKPFTYGEYSYPHTACWRGYVATWKIIDSKLMLLEVMKVDSTLEKLNVIEYFELNNYDPTIINGLVFADWYTSNLYKYEFPTYDYSYEQFLVCNYPISTDNKRIELSFKEGCLISNQLRPVNSFQIGDTLHIKVGYSSDQYRFYTPKTLIEGVIQENNGKLVRVVIASYGIEDQVAIKEIQKKLNYSPDNYWINPRYWNY